MCYDNPFFVLFLKKCQYMLFLKTLLPSYILLGENIMKIKGLDKKDVVIMRRKYGSNVITGKKKETFLSLFINTLNDPIIKILIIALFIKVIFLFRNFDWFETLGILIAIFLASIISTLSEYGRS